MELGHGRRTSDEIARGLASSQSAAGCAKEQLAFLLASRRFFPFLARNRVILCVHPYGGLLGAGHLVVALIWILGQEGALGRWVPESVIGTFNAVGVMSGIAAVDLYENKLDDTYAALDVLGNLHKAGLGTLPVRERLARAAAEARRYGGARGTP